MLHRDSIRWEKGHLGGVVDLHILHETKKVQTRSPSSLYQFMLGDVPSTDTLRWLDGVPWKHFFAHHLQPSRCSLCRQKVYCRDEIVMQEGDTGDEMYVHLGGQCIAQRNIVGADIRFS